MIIVIADDITGAAEMAGIGLRYGLRVMVSGNVGDVTPDLLVIYTNTRSMRREEAVGAVEELTRKARNSNPSFFYKKTDSVLRGHVVDEMRVQMNMLGVEAGLLVPANPSLGRIIKDGIYYVDGRPIHETGFANDPEFPVGSAEVSAMLGDANIEVLKNGSEIPEAGIVVGEAVIDEDVEQWSSHFRKPVLFAGGATFFAALLSRLYPGGKLSATSSPMSLPVLLVSGTTFPRNVHRLKQYGQLVSYMPAKLFSETAVDEKEIESWTVEVSRILSQYQKAIVAIGEHNEKGNASLLRQKTSALVKSVFSNNEVHELLIEGGSTAYAIIQKLGWHSFEPVEELQMGIVRMKVVGEMNIHLTIKPGSYDWPPQWDLTENLKSLRRSPESFGQTSNFKL